MSIETLRFLVVEDHGFQRWMLASVLETLGATQVFPAPDGAAALALLAELDPPVDIVITDLSMPGMDGMEFIRHLGENWRHVSLILVSGLDPQLISSVGTMARAYGVKLLGAIEKPVTAKKLQDAVSLHSIADAPLERASLAFSPAEVAKGIERGEFEAFFQPKVDMGSRRLIGAEAYARWRHPQKGIVGPGAFIGLLESNGLIEQLTWTMLRSATRHCQLWQKAGSDATVSVNLSPALLSDVTAAARMLAVVESEGVGPERVIFEVTESVAASDPGHALENLSRLRMMGFGLSIDDYGTGYSSMQLLSRVPFTELKIDQSFVKGALTEPSSRAVLESSLEMSRKLGIAAVAEGIETQAQWDLLRGLGCPLAQGYFIARPMDAGEFLDWVRRYRSPP
jgi:EAL domain-containing protein (putative c-di-GMP-specific phosphodiesterase class I)/AmiR/NasT family two-component response regulator